MKTNTKFNPGLRGFTRIGILILTACATIGYTGCSTTKTESNGTTTTTTGIDTSAGTQAAIAAATQIATVAANAAIETYLKAAPTHARLRLDNGAIWSARMSTERQIHQAEPTLSNLAIHNIVYHAYTKEMRRQTSSP